MRMVDAGVDLLLAGVCPGCGLPGKGVCARCHRLIMAGRVSQHSRPGIDHPLWSAGDYVDPLRRVISQAKDHHRWEAITVLGLRISYAIAALVDDLRVSGPGTLVPFPSCPKAVRERGLDFTDALARNACCRLRQVGIDLRVRSMLTHVRSVKDQSGLTTPGRHSNLKDCLVASRPSRDGWVILIDDVVTTGASLSEGVRALGVSSVPLRGLATIAATHLNLR